MEGLNVEWIPIRLLVPSIWSTGNSIGIKDIMERKIMNEEIQFREYMEELARRHERSKVYVDFMDYYISKNSESPGIKQISDYNDTEMKLFDNAYTSFVSLMNEYLKQTDWKDFIGEYYEEYILAGSKASGKGQFYTPQEVSDLLSKVVGQPVVLSEAYDAACGSARNLLDYHSKHRDIRCTGEDLDESACKMAVINFHIHGVNGVVNWIDALTREYMGTSWRIVEDKIYVTDMDMIRTMDEIMASVNLLSMSDETLGRLMKLIKEQCPIESDESKGGLDAWFKT